MQCSVDRKFIPLKLSFIFLYGGLASFIIILSAICNALNLGIHEIMIIFLSQPIFAVLARPLSGYLADRFHAHRLIYSILAVSVTVIAASIMLQSPRELPGAGHLFMECSTNGSSTTCCALNVNGSIPNDTALSNCQVCPSSGNCSAFDNATQYFNAVTSCMIIPIELQNADEMNCDLEVSENPDRFDWTFWMMLLTMVFGYSCWQSMMSLLDSIGYKMLPADQQHRWGKERIYGSVGEGVFSGLVTLMMFLHKLITESAHTDFKIPIVTFCVSMMFSVPCVWQCRLEFETKESVDMKKVVLNLRKPLSIVTFITVVVDGSLFGMLTIYGPLYIVRDLKGSKMILTLLMLVGVPFTGTFFFVSGKIIKKIGESLSMDIGMISLAVWFVLISVMENPWLFLASMVLTGPAFGLFWSSSTSFFNRIAPKGSKAVMQSLCGLGFFTLGKALGSLYGGLLYNKFGSPKGFWRVAAITALSCTVIHVVLVWALKKPSVAKEDVAIEVENGDVQEVPLTNGQVEVADEKIDDASDPMLNEIENHDAAV